MLLRARWGIDECGLGSRVCVSIRLSHGVSTDRVYKSLAKFEGEPAKDCVMRSTVHDCLTYQFVRRYLGVNHPKVMAYLSNKRRGVIFFPRDNHARCTGSLSPFAQQEYGEGRSGIGR